MKRSKLFSARENWNVDKRPVFTNQNNPKYFANYTLAIYIINNYFEKTQTFYYSIMKCMEERGVDNLFMFLSYAIFTTVIHKEYLIVVKS